MKKIISLIVATALCISFCACSNTSSDSDSVASNIESVSENFLFSDMNWDSSEESVSQKSSESKILDDNATTRYTLPDVQLYDANGTSYYFFNDSKMVRAVFKSTDSNVDSCAELISEEFDKNEAYSLSDNSQSQYSKTWLSNDGSYGYRPNRSAKDAILKVKEYAEQGYTFAVVLDLSKYFDTLNHEILINLLRKNVKDERVVQLIKRYLKSGVMENGVVIDTEEGSPQGGNLSPLLANVYLNEFDQEFLKRGVPCIRYADDIVLLAKSRASIRETLGKQYKIS